MYITTENSMNCTRKFRERHEPPQQKRRRPKQEKKKQQKYLDKKYQKRLCREYSLMKESTVTYFPREYEVDTWTIHTHNGLDEYGNCTGKLCDGKSMLCGMCLCPQYQRRIKEAKAEGRYNSECFGCITWIKDIPSNEWGNNVSTCVTQVFAQKYNFRNVNTVKLISEYLMTPPQRKRFNSWGSIYDDSDDELVWNYA